MEITSSFPVGALLLQLAEHTDQVVFAYQITGGKLVYLSPAFEHIWLRPRVDIYPEPARLFETVHPEDQSYLKSAYANLPDQRQTGKLEFRILLPDAGARWIELNAFLIEDSIIENDNGPGDQKSDTRWIVMGFARDITAEKDNTAVLHKFSDKKNTLLQILSHDLANPLLMIRMLGDMLATHTVALQDDRINGLLTQMQSISNHGINLIHSFINQEFLESTQASLLKTRADLVAKVRDLIDQYKTSEQQIDKKFYFSVSSEPIFASIDETKFLQIVTNLISNAIKFTPDGGQIGVRIEECEETVLITVEDNGIGIPEALQPELLEKFTKARRPGLKGEPTVGLGMSLIKTIIEWHNGRIWFESRENEGSTFYVEIPR